MYEIVFTLAVWVVIFVVMVMLYFTKGEGRQERTRRRGG